MFIGRQPELEYFRRRVTEIVSGDGSVNVLFVTGEAGIGKSALLTALRAECESMYPPPLVVGAECSTPVAGANVGEVEALQPWSELLRQLAATKHEQKLETRKLVGQLAMAWMRCIPVVGDVLESVADTAEIVRDRRRFGDTQVNAVDQRQTFQQYINLLRAISLKSPLVLMLDDVHWADASSVNLLFTAARALQGVPILFVVAYRPVDAALAGEGEGHAIVHIRRELERYSMCEEIPVPPLDSSDLDLLLRATYPNYADNDPFEEWLATVSDGNALFITRYLRTLEEDGVVDVRSGTIALGFQKTNVPESAYAVVRERIHRLNEVTRELLRYASVEGKTFTSSVLALITETPKLKLLQRLRIVEESHGIVENLGEQRVYSKPTTAYRFKHTLVHQALYDGLTDAERNLLHEAILDGLQDEWERVAGDVEQLPAMAVRMAAHAQVLGRYGDAARYLMRGAMALRDRGAPGEAELMIQRTMVALGNVRDDPSINDVRIEALIIRSQMDYLAGKISEALEQAVEAERENIAGNTLLRIDALIAQASALVALERLDEGERVARRVLEESVETNGHDREFRALDLIARVKRVTAQPDETLHWYQQSVEAARKSGTDTVDEATALNNIGMFLREIGRSAEAHEYLQKSLEIFRLRENLRGQATALNNLGNIAQSTGDDELARKEYEEALAISQRLGDVWTEAYCANNIGVVAMNDALHAEALEQFTRAHELSLVVADRRLEAGALYNLGYAHEQMKALGRAMDYYGNALAAYELLDDTDGVVFMLAAIGGVLTQQGAFQKAEEFFQRGVERSGGMRTTETALSLEGGMGRMELARAPMLADPERSHALVRAIDHLRQAAELSRQCSPAETEYWLQELSRARRMVDENL